MLRVWRAGQIGTEGMEHTGPQNPQPQTDILKLTLPSPRKKFPSKSLVMKNYVVVTIISLVDSSIKTPLSLPSNLFFLQDGFFLNK